jgi:hypothetical protein
VSPDVFTKYGLDKSKVVDVSISESQAHELGEDLW